MTVGIYKITNILNNKSYIGQSRNIEHRFKQHKSCRTKCTAIRNAINKYGEENFIFEILIACSIEDLNFYEEKCIEAFDTFGKLGYNLTSGGDSEKQLSQETLDKISKGNKLVWADDERRAKMLSLVQSDEVKQKRTQSLKDFYYDNPSARMVHRNNMLKVFEDEEYRKKNINNLEKLRQSKEIEEKRLVEFRKYWDNPENKDKSVKAMQQNRNEEARIKGLRDFYDSEEGKQHAAKISERMKTAFSDPEKKLFLLNKMHSGLTEEVIKDRNQKIKSFWKSDKAILSKEILRKSAKENLSKQVMCIETAQIFSSVGEAAEWLCSIVESCKSISAARSKISSVCLGKRKSCGGYTWTYNLTGS